MCGACGSWLFPLLFVWLFVFGSLHPYIFLHFGVGTSSYGNVVGDGGARLCMMLVVVSFFVFMRGVLPSAAFPRTILGSHPCVHVAGVAWHAYTCLVPSSFLALPAVFPSAPFPHNKLGSHTNFCRCPWRLVICGSCAVVSRLFLSFLVCCLFFSTRTSRLAPEARTLLSVLRHASFDFAVVVAPLFMVFCEWPTVFDVTKQRQKMFGGFQEVGENDFSFQIFALCVFLLVFFSLLRSRATCCCTNRTLLSDAGTSAS